MSRPRDWTQRQRGVDDAASSRGIVSHVWMSFSGGRRSVATVRVDPRPETSRSKGFSNGVGLGVEAVCGKVHEIVSKVPHLSALQRCPLVMHSRLRSRQPTCCYPLFSGMISLLKYDATGSRSAVRNADQTSLHWTANVRFFSASRVAVAPVGYAAMVAELQLPIKSACDFP